MNETSEQVPRFTPEMHLDDPRLHPPLPELPPRPKWIDRLDLPYVLVLVLVAWCFGGYVNSNWVIQAQGDRISAQSARITELHSQINSNTQWLRDIQEKQVQANKDTAEILAKINVQLAEIKGASQQRAKK